MDKLVDFYLISKEIKFTKGYEDLIIKDLDINKNNLVLIFLNDLISLKNKKSLLEGLINENNIEYSLYCAEELYSEDTNNDIFIINYDTKTISFRGNSCLSRNINLKLDRDIIKHIPKERNLLINTYPFIEKVLDDLLKLNDLDLELSEQQKDEIKENIHNKMGNNFYMNMKINLLKSKEIEEFEKIIDLITDEITNYIKKHTNIKWKYIKDIERYYEYNKPPYNYNTLAIKINTDDWKFDKIDENELKEKYSYGT